jgi:hypothetical protein
MPHVTELIYFHPKPSVKPEDSSNDEGLALLQVFKSTTQQSGHIGSAWGRTREDENVIVWAIGELLPSSLTLHTLVPKACLTNPGHY